MPQDLLWEKIAEVTGINVELYGRGKFAAQIKPFRELGVTPDDVDRFYSWWTTQDWRGKRGDLPTIAEMRSAWNKAFKPKPQPRKGVPEYPDPLPEPLPVEDLEAEIARIKAEYK